MLSAAGTSLGIPEGVYPRNSGIPSAPGSAYSGYPMILSVSAVYTLGTVENLASPTVSRYPRYLYVFSTVAS